jgi:CBS domain-containing protein
MTSGVAHVAGNATVQHAAELMAQKDIGLVAVADGHAGSGVLTDRDIVVRCLAQHKNPEQTLVQECMTSGMATLPEQAEVSEAARMMKDQQIRRLLVTDENGKLCGVVSLGDLATRCGDDLMSGEVLEEVSTPGAPQ